MVSKQVCCMQYFESTSGTYPTKVLVVVEFGFPCDIGYLSKD